MIRVSHTIPNFFNKQVLKQAKFSSFSSASPFFNFSNMAEILIIINVIIYLSFLIRQLIYSSLTWIDVIFSHTFVLIPFKSCLFFFCEFTLQSNKHLSIIIIIHMLMLCLIINAFLMCLFDVSNYVNNYKIFS